jgi:tripartite-type tricarboxylate transporter receptor subunit TctC
VSGALALLLLVAGTALAQPYPSKPIRMIVPFPAGGIADLYARLIGQRVADAWGQPVLVENRTGAGGNIGADAVAKSAPDGYTLVMGSFGTHAVNVSLFSSMPYDPVRDFAPIALVLEAEGLLVVHPSVPAITDLLAGQTSLLFGTRPTVLPHAKAGKLRALATIGSRRSAAAPELPTVAETLPGFEVNNWVGLLAPAGTSGEIVRRWNVEVSKIMQGADIQQRLLVEGARYTPNTPEEFGAFIKSEIAKWSPVVKASGARAD